MANNSVEINGDAMIEVIPVVLDSDGNVTNKGVPVLMNLTDFATKVIAPLLPPAPPPGG